MNPSQYPEREECQGERFIAAGRLDASDTVLLRAGMSQQFFRAKSDLAGMAMVSMISLPDGHAPKFQRNRRKRQPGTRCMGNSPGDETNSSMIRVYEVAGNAIETHENAGDFKVW